MQTLGTGSREKELLRGKRAPRRKEGELKANTRRRGGSGRKGQRLDIILFFVRAPAQIETS